MDATSRADDPELPPAVTAETRAFRCEWCGRPLDDTAEERDLAADAGRKTHRYLPRKYRACDETCRAGVARFVRRHLALGPVLWSLTVLSVLAAELKANRRCFSRVRLSDGLEHLIHRC